MSRLKTARVKPLSKAKKKRIAPYTANDIEYVDNTSERDLVVDFKVPEFSHLCPITGQPDLATIYVRFIPDQRLLETRSMHQYLWSYRNREMFHEVIVPTILDDLAGVLMPKWMQVMGEFMIRGVSWEKIVATYDEHPLSPAVLPLSRQFRFRL